MIDLVWPDSDHCDGERLGIEEVPGYDGNPAAQVLGAAQPIAGPGADQPSDVIAPSQQKLGQKRSVLAREARDERSTLGVSPVRHARRYGDDEVASDRARPSCARGGSIPLLSSS